VQRLESQGTYSSSLVKTVSSPINPTGRFFNYTFKARNLAPPGSNPDTVTLYNVIVNDNFPVGVAPTKKHWFKVKRNSTCSFSGADSRTMRCNLGRMAAEEEVEFTVEVKADGKNFAGKTALADKLNNTATLTCTGNRTATTPDADCTRQSTANTTVRPVLPILAVICGVTCIDCRLFCRALDFVRSLPHEIPVHDDELLPVNVSNQTDAYMHCGTK
jgi:hypothetical protein